MAKGRFTTGELGRSRFTAGRFSGIPSLAGSAPAAADLAIGALTPFGTAAQSTAASDGSYEGGALVVSGGSITLESSLAAGSYDVDGQTVEIETAVCSVSTGSELATAMSAAFSADDGRSIKATPSADLSGVDQNFTDLAFTTRVTLTSHDTSNPGQIGRAIWNGVTNLTVTGLLMKYDFRASDASSSQIWPISNASGVYFDSNTITGDVADGKGSEFDGAGFAHAFQGSDNDDVQWTDNTITRFMRFLVLGNSSNILISGNDVTLMAGDVLSMAGNQVLTIEDNYFGRHDTPVGSGVHRDNIQFHTDAASGINQPRDTIIRRNVIDVADGSPSQSIFMRNEAVDIHGAGSEMYYLRTTIEDNVIYNAVTHGITLGEAEDVTIQRNVLLHVGGYAIPSNSNSPRISVNAASITPVSITDNIAASVPSAETGWTVSGNQTVQITDENAADYYLDHFIASTIHTVDPTTGRHDFAILDASDIDTSVVGDQAESLAKDTPSVRPEFHVALNGDGSFDFDPTVNRHEPVDDATALYEWDFGDSNSDTGRELKSHTYASPGVYTVQLDVTPTGGSMASATAVVGVSGNLMTEFDASDGNIYQNAYGVEQLSPGVTFRTAPVDAGGGDYHIVMDGTQNVQAEFPVGRRVEGATNVELEMTLQTTAGSSSNGQLARWGSPMRLVVTAAGELQTKMVFDVEGAINFTTSGAGLLDDSPHDIRIAFDGTAQTFEVFVDDVKLVDHTLMAGETWPSNENFQVGSAFDGTGVTGQVHALNLKSDKNTALIFAATEPYPFETSMWSISDEGSGGQADVSISDFPIANLAAITDIEYDIEGRETWFSSGGIGDFTIDQGLVNGSSQSVRIRAVNAQGAGPGGTAQSVTPTGSNTAPAPFETDDWELEDGRQVSPGGALRVIILSLPATGGSAITDIEYRVDGGTWTSSGASTVGAFLISGLTNDVSHEIELRAVNAVGNSVRSDLKAAAPSIGDGNIFSDSGFETAGNWTLSSGVELVDGDTGVHFTAAAAGFAECATSAAGRAYADESTTYNFSLTARSVITGGRFRIGIVPYNAAGGLLSDGVTWEIDDSSVTNGEEETYSYSTPADTVKVGVRIQKVSGEIIWDDLSMVPA